MGIKIFFEKFEDQCEEVVVVWCGSARRTALSP
jgi:hypothetical protein